MVLPFSHFPPCGFPAQDWLIHSGEQCDLAPLFIDGWKPGRSQMAKPECALSLNVAAHNREQTPMTIHNG